ncbi:MAG: GntR family transcriptional regulator [Alphaproteobacteria bacterium]|nr:GntR family transcriptional regulator [Alphaproteobacteria bacterium]
MGSGRFEGGFGSDAPDPVRDYSLAEQVAQRLSQQILRGEYPPGTRLPEPELAIRFGVSRGPIREALFLLEREGMIENRPRRGAIVPQADPSEIANLYNLRAVLCGYACRLAAPAMNSDRMAKCRQGLEQLRAMADDPSKTSLDFLEVRTAIAGVIMHASGNPVLVNELERLNRRALMHFAMFNRLKRRRESIEDWERLLDALGRQDGEEAEKIAISQVHAARDEMLRQVKEAQSQG